MLQDIVAKRYKFIGEEHKLWKQMLVQIQYYCLHITAKMELPQGLTGMLLFSNFVIL
jgi:hypothetical protein